METNIPNEILDNVSNENGNQSAQQPDVNAEQLANGVQDVVIDPSDPAHPDHPEHHKHMSALHAAGLSHSAVKHVLPHHRDLDL